MAASPADELVGVTVTAFSWTSSQSHPYGRALLDSSDLELRAEGGQSIQLEIQRYLACADDNDATVLARVVPPALDIGCGPGRIVRALSEMGLPALGVDIAEVAVALSSDRGAPAMIRSVFERIPAEGRWPTVLLLDGNIGIGGDVSALLGRLRDVMAPDGQLLIEVSESCAAGVDEVLSVRFSARDQCFGTTFDWAVVDRAALLRHADRTGLYERDSWVSGGRCFVRLQRLSAADADDARRHSRQG